MKFNTTQRPQKQKQNSVLLTALTFVVLLYIGILILVYVVSKRANPIMLDETGKTVSAEPVRDHPQSKR